MNETSSGEETSSEEEAKVPRKSLNDWCAFAEQTRTDLLTLRHLIARGQTEAADQLIASAIHQALIAGRSMEDAGAARPAHLPARPAPGTYEYDDDD